MPQHPSQDNTWRICYGATCARAPPVLAPLIPTGIRNVYLLRLAELPGGLEALQAFVALEIRDKWLPEDADLWHAGIVEAADCGAKPVEPDGNGDGFPRKLRPIGQTEALVKFAETCLIEEQLVHIRKQLEPKQLCLLPDGPVVATRVLRGWAMDVDGSWRM